MINTDDICAAWCEVQRALEEMGAALEEDWEEYEQLLNALMGLKMALEIEEALGDD